MILNKENESNRKINYISLASVISAIAVVFLHVNGCFWQYKKGADYWFSANIIECICYFAVPVFFMISGATLINYYERYDLATYILKRVKKTCFPYLFWSVVGYFYYCFVINDSHEVSIKEIIRGLVNGKLVSVYWFFIPLFCIYLCIPIFAAISKSKRKEIITYICSIAFLINIIVPFAIRVLGLAINYPWKVYVGMDYLFFVLIGYLIAENDISKKIRIVIYCMGLFGLFLHVYGTYVLTIENGNIVQLYKGYNNLPSTLYSVAVFLFFKNVGTKILNIHLVNKLVLIISRYSFSIYLLHFFILQALTKVGVNIYPLEYRLISPLFIVGFIVLVVAVLRKIPGFDKLLPD